MLTKLCQWLRFLKHICLHHFFVFKKKQQITGILPTPRYYQLCKIARKKIGLKKYLIKLKIKIKITRLVYFQKYLSINIMVPKWSCGRSQLGHPEACRWPKTFPDQIRI